MRQDYAHARQGPPAGGGRRWHLSFALFPALALAALPKCPLCLMALASAAGLGSSVGGAWLVPLTPACLAVALGLLAFRAHRRRFYAPFCLGLVSAVVILVGRFRLDYGPLTYAGLTLLTLASLWGGRPGGRVAADTGCEC